MKLHQIKAPKGANHDRKRVGRGPGSGLGKTAGRGTKGQKSRVGNMNIGGFEGGQMPLQRRLPKIGFYHASKKFNCFNLSDLEARFEEGSVVDLASFRSSRLVKQVCDGIKILGQGNLAKKLTVRVQATSVSAKAKIEAAGGTVEIVPLTDSKSQAAS